MDAHPYLVPLIYRPHTHISFPLSPFCSPSLPPSHTAPKTAWCRRHCHALRLSFCIQSLHLNPIPQSGHTTGDRVPKALQSRRPDLCQYYTNALSFFFVFAQTNVVSLHHHHLVPRRCAAEPNIPCTVTTEGLQTQLFAATVSFPLHRQNHAKTLGHAYFVHVWTVNQHLLPTPPPPPLHSTPNILRLSQLLFLSFSSSVVFMTYSPSALPFAFKASPQLPTLSECAHRSACVVAALNHHHPASCGHSPTGHSGILQQFTPYSIIACATCTPHPTPSCLLQEAQCVPCYPPL